MANLKYGSSGDDVKKLQEALGFTGADVDGQFGKKTQQAVIDYQKANGLSVDGVVGDKTWTKLKNLNPGDSGVGLNPVNPGAQVQSVTQQPQTGAETKSTGIYNYAPYEPSDAVKQAEAMLQQQLANKPGAYTSPWQAQLDETLNKILNREPFSYDLNGDLLYQQYKDQAVTMGQQAAMDVMGQAQAMTGGYGNSYAQSVGQQTYQGHLQQLNDKIPELYQLALNQYNREGDELYNQYGMYADREAQDYGRYRDSMSDYYTELDRLANDARYHGEQEYGRWQDKVNMDYAMHRDSVADKQWQAQFDEAKRQYDQQYELSKSKGSGGGGSPDKDKEYSKWSQEADEYWTGLLDGADSLPAVEAIGDRMAGVGYNPAFVATIVDVYKAKFIDEENEDEDKDKDKPKNYTTTGGGGGGRFVMHTLN